MDYKEIINYETELNFFLSNYAVCLLGVTAQNLEKIENKNFNKKEIQYDSENSLFIVPINSSSGTFFTIHAFNDKENINLNILRELKKSFDSICKYYYSSASSKNEKTIYQFNYPTKFAHINQLEYATQIAISRWISSFGCKTSDLTKSSSVRIESLLKLLDDWSQRTYEGKKSFIFLFGKP